METATEAEAVEEGTFSIWDWKGYPTKGVRPSGTFKLVPKGQTAQLREIVKIENGAIRDEAERLGHPFTGSQVHEVKPIKFGGSPTDPANKVIVPDELHHLYIQGFGTSCSGRLKRRR
jgi:filamentous hemagglutinin